MTGVYHGSFGNWVALACVFGGILSKRFGERRIALLALLISLLCCLLFPWIADSGLTSFALLILFLWGGAVVMDSPLFSAQVAANTNPSSRGTAFTIVNGVGFAITIVSIQLIGSMLNHHQSLWVIPVLAVGPGIGLLYNVVRVRSNWIQSRRLSSTFFNNHRLHELFHLNSFGSTANPVTLLKCAKRFSAYYPCCLYVLIPELPLSQLSYRNP